MKAYHLKPFTTSFSSNSVRIPGSKSLTNRLLLLAAMAGGVGTLRSALLSEDTQIMIDALKVLGCIYDLDFKNNICRQKRGIQPLAGAKLHVGNAGTVARFLPPIVAARMHGCFDFEGSLIMEQRPMHPLLDVLAYQGASIEYNKRKGSYPFTLYSKGLLGGPIDIQGNESSQFISGMLMAAPFAKKDVEIHVKGECVSQPFIAMTCQLMRQFGVAVNESGHTYQVEVGQLYQWPSEVFKIEPDLTAASYFAALTLINQDFLVIEGASNESLQGDIGFLDLLQRVGWLTVQTVPTGIKISALTVPDSIDYDFKDISDTFMTLAALSPQIKEKTVIRGIAHTRKQESDRLIAVAEALTTLGQTVDTGDDYLIIKSNLAKLKALTVDAPVCVRTHGDHRMAMSFGVLGMSDIHGDGRPWLMLDDAACCAKTFPNFFDTLEQLR